MNIPKIKYVFDRKHKAGREKKGSVEMRITFNRVQKFVSTGISVYPKEWNATKEAVVNVSEAMELNKILNAMKQKAFKIISDMVDSDNIDIAVIPAMLKSRRVDVSFIEYVESRMQKKNVGEYTKKSYTTFLNKLEEYGKILYFADITEKAIRDWDEWLHAYTWTAYDRFNKKVIKKYSQATIGAFHKNMKTFISDAVVDGFLQNNVYVSKRIKISKGSTRIEQFLTKEQVERLETAKMPTKSLAEARDLFLIQIYTGISYIDLMSYDFTKCRNAEDYSVFSGIRSKTGTIFTFVMTPKAKKILQRYKFALPKLPNQKYNVKLKLIADAAGIEENITSHMGRRTCGYILMNAGVPIAVISRILGHSSISMTEKAYARLLDDTIAEEVKKHVK